MFLCTTYDSLSYILATASMKNFIDKPTRSLRVFFAIILMIQPVSNNVYGWKRLIYVAFSCNICTINDYLHILNITIFKNAIKFKKIIEQISLKNPFDVDKTSIVFIPGAGMDHRIISMFNLDDLDNEYNVLGIDLPDMDILQG